LPESFLVAKISGNLRDVSWARKLGVLTYPLLRYTADVHLGAVRVGVASCAAAFFVSTTACPQPLSEALAVGGTGVCPPPEAVRAAIFQLTSAERRRALPPQARVVVSDEGASYRVSVTGEGTTAQKTYSDPGRECARRTRFAAVFAILTLMPPELEPDPELSSKSEPVPRPIAESSSGSTPPPPSTSTSTITPKSDGSARHEDQEQPESSLPSMSGPRVRPSVRFELVGLGEQAVGAGGEPRVRSLGGEIRALLARAELAPLVTLGYAPATTLDAGLTEVEVQRTQLSLGVRAQTQLGPIDLGAELALLGALEHIAGLGFEHPASGNGFELGARAAALLSLAANRVGPMLAFHASVFPSPNTFEALPRGEVGHMPHLWLGLSAGLFFGL
jgi:hypothetical protein